jgi:hypothetical protein
MNLGSTKRELKDKSDEFEEIRSSPFLLLESFHENLKEM